MSCHRRRPRGRRRAGAGTCERTVGGARRMSPEKAAKRAKAGRTSRRGGGAAPERETARRPETDRRYVDVDPWAMLLEQLMVVPEERPAEGGSADGPEGEREPAEATRRPAKPGKRGR